ncbi:hypothetical protein M9Y10_019203 [Tritrichomonas musculus]|uniref:Viral A-type inclusion protein n=1 Tax=Tritrichomonas musculus TaxID=1915356 RepID=A0ABR2HKK7_9EUKA
MSDLDTLNNYSSSEMDRLRNGGDPSYREAYDQLLKEKTNLENNFREALKISNQVNDLHKENDQFRKLLTELRSENEDYKQRLDLSVQTNQELRNKLNEEKKSSNSIRGADLSSMNKQIEGVKKACKQQIDEIYERLENVQGELERESLEKKHLISQINNILEESRRYFSLQFNNVDDLIRHLQTPQISSDLTLPTTLNSNTTINKSTSAQQADPQLQKKVKHLKKQLKEEQAKGEDQEGKILKLNNEIKNQKQIHDSEVRKLQEQIENLEADNKSLQHNNDAIRQQHNDQVDEFENRLQKKNNEIKTYKQKFKALKKELRDQRIGQAAQGIPINDDDHRSVSSRSSTSSSVSAPSSNHKVTTRNLDFVRAESVDSSLQDRIADLTDQLNQANSKKNEYQRKLRDSDDRVSAINSELIKLRTENDTLRKLYDTVKDERESFRIALAKNEESKRELAAKQAIAPKQPNKKAIKLQKALDTEKQKVYTLQDNESRLQGKIDDLESAMRLLQQSANDAKEEAKKANSELNEFRRQSEINQPPTDEDLLPPSAYRCDEFDTALSAAIGRIANNNALQPVSKIQNCFKTIRKYYQKQLAERDEALDQAFSENQTLSSAFNQFLQDASIALCNQAYTLQDFFANNAGQKLVDQIQQLRTNFADLKHQHELQRGFENAFTSNFAEYITEPADPIRALSEVKDRIDTQKVQIAARSKKVHDLKAQLKNQQSLLKTKDIDLEQEREQLDLQKQELESRLVTLNKTVNDLRAQNQSLTNDLEVVNKTLEETQMTLSQEQSDHNTTMLEEAATKEANLKNEIKKRTQENKQLRQQINENSKTVSVLKQQVQTARNEKKQAEDEIEELRRQVHDVEKQAAARLEAEKQNITTSYDAAIKELKEQCDKHRKDVERMAAEVSECDLRYASLQQEINSLKKEKRKYENEVNSMKGQLEREKKLMETKIRAEKVQAESIYSAKLEEQKARAEADKRKIFALGADAFRSFFNPNEQIDERSFKAVLDRAKNTIAQLQKSDGEIRRLLGAGESQTTLDAVAQLIMTKTSTKGF